MAEPNDGLRVAAVDRGFITRKTGTILSSDRLQASLNGEEFERRDTW
jgi:hypothetical protein